MGWAKSMPFASIIPTNPRTHPAQFGKKILRIDRLAKWGFFESAILDFFFCIFQRVLFQILWKTDSCPDFLFFRLETQSNFAQFTELENMQVPSQYLKSLTQITKKWSNDQFSRRFGIDLVWKILSQLSKGLPKIIDTN